MKNILIGLMVLFIAVGLVGQMVEDTFASFSDIEISEDNYLDTADLDLKVNGNDDWDVETFFDIPNGEICTTYASSPSPIPLWNEGSVEGPLYLHIKSLVGPDNLSQNVDVEIWYNGNWVISESIYNLACQQIELGHMPGDGMITEVTMELHAIAGAPGESLTFDIAFELLGGCGYSDIETSQGNYFELGSEHEGCSPGFWKRHTHAWEPTGYETGDFFNATFECDAFDPDRTLLEAVGYGGGGLDALGRHAVAALLNVAHPDVEYALTGEEVIDKVQEAIESKEYDAAQKELEAHNKHEPAGCPLGE